jgi:hypothetical protein
VAAEDQFEGEGPAVDLNLVSRALGEELVAGCPALPTALPVASAPSAPGQLNETGAVEIDAGPTYLALGRTTLALFSYKPGAFAFAPGKKLADHDLSEIAACEFWPARTGSSRLFVTTTSGVTYDLTIALAHRGTAHRIAASIGEHLRSNAA